MPVSRLRIKTKGNAPTAGFRLRETWVPERGESQGLARCIGHRSSIRFYDFLTHSLLFGSSASGHFRLSSRPQRTPAWRAEIEAKTDDHGLSHGRLALLPSPT